MAVLFWKQNSASQDLLSTMDEIVAEMNAAGTVTLTNTGAITVCVDEAAGVNTLHTWDQQGNGAKRLCHYGVIDSIAFTRVRSKTAESLGDPYTNYNGQQWGYYADAETGLLLCTYRYYDPSNAGSPEIRLVMTVHGGYVGNGPRQLDGLRRRNPNYSGSGASWPK